MIPQNLDEFSLTIKGGLISEGVFTKLQIPSSHKEIRSINFPFPYEDGSRTVMGVK